MMRYAFIEKNEIRPTKTSTTTYYRKQFTNSYLVQTLLQLLDIKRVRTRVD